ncbi:MAG: BamA/TamA family outer membrane protein [Candidatus Acidiferrum sp.]
MAVLQGKEAAKYFSACCAGWQPALQIRCYEVGLNFRAVSLGALFVWFWVVTILGAGGARLAWAQDAPAQQPTQETTPSPAGDSSGSKPESSSAKPSTTDAKSGEQKAEKKKRLKGAFVIAPLPEVSPAIGSGVIPVVAYIFPFQMKDQTSPPSVVGAAADVTNNGTRLYGFGEDLYLKHAKYEIKSAYGRGNINYNLYGVGFVNGNEGLKLPLTQSGELFFVDFLRNIGWDVYVGGRFISGNSFVTLRPSSGNTPPVPPGVGLQTNLRALGFEILRDSRPNRFYPLKGSWIDFTGDFFAQDLGSKYSYQSYKFTFNKYFSLNDKQVIAYNLVLCGTGGAPPFYGNCIYGTNNELRGYTAGRYLDKYMFATQAEYRLVLPWKFGVVAFGGLGEVAPGASKFRSNQFLPAGGTGIRYLLSKKYHVNLRTDFAWGKDNFTWSMGVGEAF